MHDSRNLAIAVLSITATILLVGVLLSDVGGRNEALAIGQLDRGGDYVMLTGQFTQNTEMVYVVDAAAHRLNAYTYDTVRRQLVLWDSQDLGKLFAETRPR